MQYLNSILGAIENSCCVTIISTGESAAAVFKDLGKLSRIYRDQLVYPLIAAAREGTLKDAPIAVWNIGLIPRLIGFRYLRIYANTQIWH